MTGSTIQGDDDREPWTEEGHREATITYPIVDDEVLLIYKKRGFGAGRYNGPGGKLEPGETPREAAIRETREEVGATPADLRKLGELDFRMAGEAVHYVHVFRAASLDGTPTETEEARPEWFPLDGVPYDEMWEDDRLWLPNVFEGRPFRCTVRFDDEERLLDHDLRLDVEL